MTAAELIAALVAADPRRDYYIRRSMKRPRWKKGTPPKDGKTYEMRRRFRVCFSIHPRSPYAWTTAIWSPSAWWNGKSFVERNQFTGEERWLNSPNEWRERA